MFFYNVCSGKVLLDGPIDSATVDSNVKLLGTQAMMAGLDFMFWTLFIRLTGTQLHVVVAVFDVAPLTLQAAFVTFLLLRAHTTRHGQGYAPCCASEQALAREDPSKGCCAKGGLHVVKATACCDEEAVDSARLEKQALMY